MHLCKYCNYLTSSYYDYKKHCLTKKHIVTVNLNNDNNDNEPEVNLFTCDYCSKEYSEKYSFNRHKKNCKYKEFGLLTLNLEKQIEVERLKFENEMIKKDLQIANIQNAKQIINQNINTVNNNIKQQNNINNLTKIENLNINFGDVIDINTFIENYKNEYGLTNKQTEILLENYKNGGINSCISSLVYYLKESAIQQYKEIKGKEISMSDIILPFILSDKCVRDHFEKNDTGKWDKTIVVDNIKKIVGITDDHVYKHHNTHLQLNDQHKKKLINGVLKSSDYSKLTLLSKPNLYKINEDNKKIKQTEINNLLKNTIEDDEMSLL